ncbi:hypothetical protein [Lysinibacillus pakistanensis]|uniref:Pre-toxin TG domain-containing protein n=1 Tax=Lysinibacillus pakistanensis TaxID=759811 RepID=A0AAX3X576_9BACI|nr:hypothetical protein [Lysinibacillus pakistanensis]MDM5233401.1 hypothetical protein [Lysinibacillus pakistanensis]WHY48875.1 hypothetical protein QNH22_11825 [Lysinibacillus pakistanensis]WHY53887.1 hypothetical protein QNH24_11805 [Lysinibacillus pakistanensis]
MVSNINRYSTNTYITTSYSDYDRIVVDADRYKRENPNTNDSVTISDSSRQKQQTAKQSSSNLLDKVKDWSNSSVQWLKDAGNFVKDAVKAGIDFLVLDDVKTIFDPNAGALDKSLAAISLFPAGKVVKSGKIYGLLKKSGKNDVVDAFAGLGSIQKFNKKGILMDGNSSTGWKHINKRHISGTSADKNTTLFPKHLGEAKIKNLIMESLEKGTLQSTHADGTKVYTYNPNKYGISEMTTVVTKDNIIKTSYPTKGTSVLTKRESELEKKKLK